MTSLYAFLNPRTPNIIHAACWAPARFVRCRCPWKPPGVTTLDALSVLPTAGAGEPRSAYNAAAAAELSLGGGWPAGMREGRGAEGARGRGARGLGKANYSLGKSKDSQASKGQSGKAKDSQANQRTVSQAKQRTVRQSKGPSVRQSKGQSGKPRTVRQAKDRCQASKGPLSGKLRTVRQAKDRCQASKGLSGKPRPFPRLVKGLYFNDRSITFPQHHRFILN